MNLMRIDKFPEDFIQWFITQGVLEEDIKLLRSIRGISLASITEDIKGNSINKNITFDFDMYEVEESC